MIFLKTDFGNKSSSLPQHFHITYNLLNFKLILQNHKTQLIFLTFAVCTKSKHEQIFKMYTLTKPGWEGMNWMLWDYLGTAQTVRSQCNYQTICIP